MGIALALNTGKVIICNQWVELPVTDTVVREVEALGRKRKQANVDKHGYFFSWSKLRSFCDTELSPVLINLPDEGPDTIEEADAQHAPIDIPEIQGAEEKNAIVPFNLPVNENDATKITMVNPTKGRKLNKATPATKTPVTMSNQVTQTNHPHPNSLQNELRPPTISDKKQRRIKVSVADTTESIANSSNTKEPSS